MKPFLHHSCTVFRSFPGGGPCKSTTYTESCTIAILEIWRDTVRKNILPGCQSWHLTLEHPGRDACPTMPCALGRFSSGRGDGGGYSVGSYNTRS